MTKKAACELILVRSQIGYFPCLKLLAAEFANLLPTVAWPPMRIMPGFVIGEAHAASAWAAADVCNPCRKSAARWAWDAAEKMARLSSFRASINQQQIIM